jgi:hypothetical protein
VARDADAAAAYAARATLATDLGVILRTLGLLARRAFGREGGR